ncbi:MAG: mechanosensitive ion channel family protein [Rhodothermales bacterium]
MDIAAVETLVTDLLTIFLPKLVGVVILLVVAWTVAKWAGKRVTKTTEERLDLTIALFLGSLTRYLILIMALLGCLNIFGFETTSFAAVLGAAGLAIGLAMQGTLSNFSAGLMLLIFRPFKVNDVVSTAGVTGKVIHLNLFTTELDTPDNRRIIVPNGSIFGSTIENVTFHDTRRVDVSVGTDYPADISQTRETLLGAVANLEGVHAEPAPVAYLTELGASSIDWSVRIWANTDDYWLVRERATQAIKNALDDAGIGIPFPRMDVHLGGKIVSE